MYPVSEDFLQTAQENTRKYYWTGKITSKNGVLYDFGAEDIVNQDVTGEDIQTYNGRL